MSSSRDLISRKPSNSNNSNLSNAFVAQCQQMARANQAALAAAATAMAALAAASSTPNQNPNLNPNPNPNPNPNLNLNLNLNPNSNPNANYLSTLLQYYYHSANNLGNTFNCNTNTNTSNNNNNNNTITLNTQSRPLIHHQHQDPRLAPFDSTSDRLLASLYEMNDEPSDDAIKLIAERINSSYDNVANYFHHRRQADREALKDALSSVDWNQQSAMLNIVSQPNIVSPNVPCLSPFENEKPHPPSAPSSTLLAKLTAVTSRPNAHIMARQLDPKMIDLLEAFYTINDNPEPSAIEMIAKRINSSIDLVADWFDSKRAKLNPHVGPRSPPAKKREGGRVVTFSEYQRSLLEAIFDENNYLHPQEYEELSNLIQVPARNIKIWFKNRRSKQRLSGRITVSGVQ